MTAGQVPARRAKTVAVEMDPCVVPTAPLCGLVAEFVEGWLRTRRSRKGQGYGKEMEESYIEPVSPYTFLAFDTGLPETEIRKVRNPARYPLTELRFADALVASIGSPDMLHDDQLEPRPNPLVATGHGDCCSGSTSANGLTGRVTPGAIIKAGQSGELGPARRV